MIRIFGFLFGLGCLILVAWAIALVASTVSGRKRRQQNRLPQQPSLTPPEIQERQCHCRLTRVRISQMMQDCHSIWSFFWRKNYLKLAYHDRQSSLWRVFADDVHLLPLHKIDTLGAFQFNLSTTVIL